MHNNEITIWVVLASTFIGMVCNGIPFKGQMRGLKELVMFLVFSASVMTIASVQFGFLGFAAAIIGLAILAGIWFLWVEGLMGLAVGVVIAIALAIAAIIHWGFFTLTAAVVLCFVFASWFHETFEHYK